jgi:hypothetical protein
MKSHPYSPNKSLGFSEAYYFLGIFTLGRFRVIMSAPDYSPDHILN